MLADVKFILVVLTWAPVIAMFTEDVERRCNIFLFWLQNVLVIERVVTFT